MPKNNHKKQWQPRTLPKGMTVEQMEEIFTDRLADLIVRLLDYRQEQKMKAQEEAEAKEKQHA